MSGATNKDIIVYAGVVLLTLFNITFTSYSVKESEQKFCDIITTINRAYQDPNYPPPTTDLGRRIKQNYYELENRLGC